MLGDLEPITIEFLIDNPEILSQLNQTEGHFNDAADKIQASATRAANAIQALHDKGGFSDSQAELDAYAQSLVGLGDSGRVALSGLDENIRLLNADLEAGNITAEAFKAEVERMTAANAENAASIQQTSVAVEEEAGLLEGLLLTLKELEEENLTIVDPADLARSNARIQELEAEIYRASNAGKVGFDEFGNKIKAASAELDKPVGKLNRLQYALELFRQQSASSFNPDIISKYNAKIQATEEEITRTKNIGKAGFDELGNAAAQSTNFFSKAWSQLRLLAQILPGIGIGGIAAFAVGPIIDYISKLDIFKGKLDLLAINLKNYNEVNLNAAKDAGKQAADLRILYLAATDVTNSIHNRTLAARELQKEFPETFGNSTALAIQNGKEKDSYDQLTESVFKTAKAKASVAKIEALAGQNAAAEFQKQKIDAARENELKAYAQFQKDNAERYKKGESFLAPGSGQDLANIQDIKDRAAAAYKAQNDVINNNQRQIDFYTKFAGGNNELAKSLTEGLEKSDLKKAAQLAKEQEAAAEELIRTQQSIAQRVRELIDNNIQKALTPDQSSLTQISDQFQNLVFQINQANGKYDAFLKKYGQKGVDAFNANPANKVKLTKTDPNSVLPAEDLALLNQANLNENKYIQEDIEKKKKLYADYEAFKIKAGSQAAAAEYADLLKSGKDFQTYLDNIGKSIDANDQSGPIQQRRDLLKKANDENIQAQKKAFEDLLVQSVTYNEKRAVLISGGIEAEKKLRDAGFSDRADQAAKQTQEELTALDEANFKKLSAYKSLFDGIENLTRKQTADDIDELYKTAVGNLALNIITNGKSGITSDTFLKITKDLNGAILALKNSRSAQTLNDIGGAFNSIAGEVSNVSTALGSMINAAGSSLQSIGKVIELQNSLADSNKSAKQHQSDLVNEVAIGVTSAITIIDNVVSSISARKAAEKAYYDSIIASQNQYNIALDDQVRLQAEINSNLFLKDYKADIASASTALAKENEQFAQSLIALQNGKAVSGQKNAVDGNSILKDAAAGAVGGAVIGGIPGAVIGGIGGALVGLFAGTKKVDTYAPLLSKYPDLIKKAKDGTDEFNDALAKNLIQNNLVDDSTKVLLQNTLDLNAARQQAIDQINSDIKDLAGSLGNDLRNALVNAFESGEDAFGAFKGTVEKGIQDIVSQFLFQDIFGTEFDKLSDSLKASFSTTGDQNPIDDLTAFYKEAGPLAQQYADALAAAQQAAKAQGLDLFQSGDSTSSTGVVGAIKGITEDQANALEGIERGIQLSAARQNDLTAAGNDTMSKQLAEIRSQSLLQKQIAADTKRTADNTDTMVTSLKSIDKNTGDSTGAILRAAGKVL